MAQIIAAPEVHAQPIVIRSAVRETASMIEIPPVNIDAAAENNLNTLIFSIGHHTTLNRKYLGDFLV